MPAQNVPKIDPTKTRMVNFRTKAVTINASKAPTSSFNITRGGTKTLSNNYVQKGEIMFFNLGGENKTAILSNIGDNDGNDKNEWVFIDSPINY